MSCIIIFFSKSGEGGSFLRCRKILSYTFKVPRGGSAGQIFVTAGLRKLNALLSNLIFKFIQRLNESTYSIIVAFSNPFKNCTCYSSRQRMYWLKCLLIIYFLTLYFMVCFFFICISMDSSLFHNIFLHLLRLLKR